MWLIHLLHHFRCQPWLLKSITATSVFVGAHLLPAALPCLCWPRGCSFSLLHLLTSCSGHTPVAVNFNHCLSVFLCLYVSLCVSVSWPAFLLAIFNSCRGLDSIKSKCSLIYLYFFPLTLIVICLCAWQSAFLFRWLGWQVNWSSGVPLEKVLHKNPQTSFKDRFEICVCLLIIRLLRISDFRVVPQTSMSRRFLWGWRLLGMWISLQPSIEL